MRIGCWGIALLAAVGAMSGGWAQEPAMQTVGVELKGDTMVYRVVPVPIRRGPGGRGRAWTVEQKLFALSKCWMEVHRNYAYLDRFGVGRWDSLYRALITPAMQTRDDLEFYRLLAGFYASLGNSRTYVRTFRNFPLTSIGYEEGWVLRLMDVGGHVVVSEVCEEKAAILPPGSEILSVNGKPVGERIAGLMPCIPASTERTRRRWAVRILLYGPVGTSHEVEFRRPDGSEGSVRLVNPRYGAEPDVDMPCAALPGYSGTELNENFRLMWYPGDVAYLKIGSFEYGEAQAFRNAFPEIRARARKLILDLRDNRQGINYTAAETFSRLTRDTVLYGPVSRSRIHDAALAAEGDRLFDPEELAGSARARIAHQHYRGRAFSEPEREEYRFPEERDGRLVVPTVILVNDVTANAAETFVAWASSQSHISTVGVATSGSAGKKVTYEVLPGLLCDVCTEEVRLPDGREFVGCGIAPDVVVENTMQDVLSGRDALLEKALEILRDK